MNDLDNLKDLAEYSDLQTKLLTLLEIEKYVLQQKVAVKDRMRKLIPAPIDQEATK